MPFEWTVKRTFVGRDDGIVPTSSFCGGRLRLKRNALQSLHPFRRTLMEIALYARVSTNRQRQAQTIEQQLQRLRAAVADHPDWHLAEEHIYCDDGISGSRLNRPGLDRLRDQAARGAFACLVIVAPDRLARNSVHQVLIIDELNQVGCAVEFLERPMTDDPHDQLLLQIRGAVAEYERSLIAERMRRGRQAKLRSGQLLPWSVPPYGYILDPERPRDPSRVRLDPVKAAVVAESFAWYTDPTQPSTLYQIAKRLSDDNIPTPKGAHRWNPTTVHNILCNSAYAGPAYGYKIRQVPAQRRKSALRPAGRGQSYCATPPEEWIPIPVPALVSQAVFDAAQARLQRNRDLARRHNTTHHYLLRGLVSCGKCQLACTARTVHPGYDYYLCRGRTDSLQFRAGERCTARYAPASALDDLVWADLCRILTDPSVITHELTRAQAGDWLPQVLQSRRTTLQDAIAQLERQQARLLDVYLAGIVGRDEFERKRGELDQTQGGLAQQLRQLEVQIQQQIDVAGLARGIEAFCQRIEPTLAHLTFDQRRQLVELLIDRVIVTDGQVEIRYVIPTNPKGEQAAFCQLHQDYFDHIGGANRLPMCLREVVEGQAGGLVTLEALDRAGISRGILGDEGRPGLLGLCPRVLVENGLEFGLELGALGLRDVAQDVCQLMLATALPLGGGELERDGVEHRLMTSGDPQIDRLHPTLLEIVQQAFPGPLILAFPNREGQHLAFTGQRDPNHCQDRRFVAFIFIDYGEISATGKDVAVVGRKRALFPGVELGLQRVKDARDRGRTRLAAREGLDHRAHLRGTHPSHEYLTNRPIQFGLSSLVALEELRANPLPGSWHRQGFNRSQSSHQVAGVAPVALIPSARAALIPSGADQRGHFFFQHTHQRQPNRRP